MQVIRDADAASSPSMASITQCVPCNRPPAAGADADRLFAWTYNGLIPHAALMRSIELFATRVLPRVG